jgi:hypothetical protein
MFFHNWVSQATDEDPRREWEPIARLEEIGAEKLPGASHINTEKQSARLTASGWNPAFDHQCEPTEPTEGPTDLPRTKTL